MRRRRRERLSGVGALITAERVRSPARFPTPRIILAGSMNYRHHLEMKNVPIPTEPSAFVKVTDTLTGSGKPIVIPKLFPSMVDFEGELTIVIGWDCYNVSAEEAKSCIAGYTIPNDVSSRD